jgi:hypothetical protein
LVHVSRKAMRASRPTSSGNLVEAAGVEPDTCVESVQLIDFVNVRIGSISRIAKSTVRSLYSDFPEFQQLPNSTFRRSRLAKKSILKCGSSISRFLRCRKPVRQLCNKPVLLPSPFPSFKLTRRSRRTIRRSNEWTAGNGRI